MRIPGISTRQLADLVRDVADRLFVDASRDSQVSTDVSTSLDAIAPVPAERPRRSLLTRSGSPFELSVKTRVGAAADLRWVVDVGDPDQGLVANRARYLAAFGALSPTVAGMASTLLDVGLDGAPPNTPPRVMVGVGHAPTWRRTTLYLPTAWWDPDALRSRLRSADADLPLPDVRGAAWLPGVPPEIEVAGWDVRDGSMISAKTYRWLPMTAETSSACRAVGDPLGAASTVVERFGARVPEPARQRAGFLQLTGADGTSPKLFFFTRAWGLAQPEMMLELFRLSADLGLDLYPLEVVRSACARHRVTMELGLLAVGGPADDAVMTWYFWPIDARLG